MNFNIKQFIDDDENPHPPGSQGWFRHEKFLEEQNKNKEMGCAEKIEKHFIDLYQALEKIKLEKKYLSAGGQMKLLTEKIKTAKDLLSAILNKVEYYIQTVKTHGSARLNKDFENNLDYKSENEKAGLNRKLAHNALIDEINTARRFILNNFGLIDNESIEKWEDSEDDAGRPILHVERIQFTNNVICPDNINLDDRNMVTDWAEQIYKCMTQIKNRLNGKEG